ncbi:guanylate-binding protein 7-like [Psammomys obesus]|uniref:guanylate-binding protein 7-like n=1 Tax=Psammomys obesus TaxID=48139 RepID=UPI0024531E2C|nr:guanylate-binding protein 7-like [Psammomys obesus]
MMEESILQSDKALTDEQKARAEERAKKEAAERETKLMMQKQKEHKEAMDAHIRSLSENISQLENKMQREKDNYLREQERVLDHKMKALRELLLEGVEEKFDDLRREIKLMEEEIEATKSSPTQNILDIAGNIFAEALPMLCKIGMKMLSNYVAGKDPSQTQY